MPFVNGETLIGWGVVRNSPWHFAGLFPTEEQAKAKAREMGSEYIVAYGENRAGSDDFVFSTRAA